MNITTIIGILASFFTAISLLPQLIKLLKEKRSSDISMLYADHIVYWPCTVDLVWRENK